MGTFLTDPTRLFSVTRVAQALGYIEYRARIEGAGTDVALDLLRLSIGIESADDLVADLSGALA